MQFEVTLVKVFRSLVTYTCVFNYPGLKWQLKIDILTAIIVVPIIDTMRSVITRLVMRYR